MPIPPDAVKCEGFGCTSDVQVYSSLCLSCGSTYCEICWERQGPHQPGKVGLDGLPHEKTDMDTYARLKAILDPPEDISVLSRLHQEDETTTWFGIEKDQNNHPIFQDYGRYAALMADTKQPNAGVRYPQLVSFIGQTGAGKSTLIKMLVSLKEQKLSFRSSPFESPVVGSTKHDKSPTSGDVHLFADPETAYTRLPMLYADCEGLEGGETAPIANKLRQTMATQDHGHTRHRIFRGHPRKLVYAKTNTEAMNREWAVRKVYPRLLYTFSDVIVFVLRNAKTFESSTLKLLLEWASTSLESSINQPALPHAIIVLNSTTPGVDEDEWDIATATKRLMDQVRDVVFTNPFFAAYADHWRRKGAAVGSMLDLFRCYYADISVVRVPQKGRYMLINSQINKLHQEIVKHCDASFSAKDEAHMLSNVDELNSYLQAGFDHFTTKENVPFNFVDVAFKNNPIPRDFGDHILGMAIKIQEVTHVRNGSKLFEALSFMVASCIFTDCIRQSRPGKVLDLFDKFYASPCTAALEHFCDKFWPCSFVSKRNKACVNVRSSHTSKGHQCAKGKVIGSGAYVSGFSSFEFSNTWITYLKRELQQVESVFEQRRNAGVPIRGAPLTASDSSLAYQLHQRQMERFYSSFFEGVTASDFVSLTTCFGCLMKVPEHPLQCGHVLCTTCIKAYGHPNDSNSVNMKGCPLHPSHRYKKPWIIRFKPDYAGVRILTLDGGGMRGITELEVLRAVEQAIGGKIPIQAFFDLIIGTSTGGIIALGLGVKQWSVNHCVTEFVRLCEQAFTPRELSTYTGLVKATTLALGSKYKTAPLRDVLHGAFGEEQLYGGQRKANCVYNTQVAVTATSGTGEEGLILANYSRHEEKEPNYRFVFPHNLQIWEAASATSAAPTYFKPFVSSNPARTYLDGAIYYNNPVRVANHERKFLWPDVAENPPDILLSIGTGMNGERVEKEQPLGLPGLSSAVRQTKPKSRNKTAKWLNKLNPKAEKTLKKEKHSRFVSKFFNVLVRDATLFASDISSYATHIANNLLDAQVNRMDNVLDSELQWKQFHEDIFDSKQAQDDESRYIRVNLDLEQDPPKLDEKTKLSELQDLTTRILKTDDYRNMIETIAHRLIASCFYFFKEHISHDEVSGIWTCKGRISCRFDGNSSELRSNMRELGDYLRYQQVSSYQPFFSVQTQIKDPVTNQIPITERMIEDMIQRAEFRFESPVIEIQLPSQLSSTMIYLRLRGVHSDESCFYPISGFPRYLITENTINGGLFKPTEDKPTDFVRATRPNKRAELIRERRYVGLVVANDPKIVSSSDKVVGVTAEESHKSGEKSIPDDTEKSSAANKCRPSRYYGQETPPKHVPSDDTMQKLSIKELRAQAENLLPLNTQVELEDAEELINQISPSVTMIDGQDIPDFGSDDSDGPFSDLDFA